MAENTGLVFKLFTDVTNFSSGLKKAQGDLGNFNNQLKNIGGMIAGAFTAGAIINFGKEAVKLAANAEAIQTAFSRIDGSQYMDAMRKATRGTVSDIELMKQAVRASNFKIPLEQLGSLFEFARRRAEETGQSVDYLVDSIIVGIGRKSPLILDNLGISAVALKEKLNGASSEAASIGDVAKAVGAIASEELAKMGAEAETSRQKMDSLVSTWDNLKLSIGKAILESETFQFVLENIQSISENIDAKNAIEVADGFVRFNNINTSNLKSVNDQLALVEKTMNGLTTLSDSWFDKVFSPGEAADAKNKYSQLLTIWNELKKAQTELDNPVTVPNFDYASLVPPKAELTKLQKLREELSKAVGIYGKLNAELAINKALTDEANNTETIRRLRQENALLEARKQILDAIGTPMKKLEGKKGQGKFATMSYDSNLTPVNNGASNTQINTGSKNVDLIKSYAELESWLENVSSLVQSASQEIIASTAESFGSLISGDIGLDVFFNNILSQMMEFAKQFGRQLIALGIGKEALDKMFAFPGGGAIAIAAGVALIGMAQVIQSSLQNNLPQLATGTNHIPKNGPYFLHEGEAVIPKRFNQGNGMMPSTIRIVGNLHGRDIRLSAERDSYYNKRA